MEVISNPLIRSLKVVRSSWTFHPTITNDRMNILKITALLLLSFLFLPPTQAQNNATLKKIDTYLQNYMDSVPVPGLAVVIVKEDEVIFQKGYGVERMGRAKAMTPQSSLAIGELTMSMTALAILQLAEKGQLSLEDKVTKHLPWFRTANKEFSDQITIRMLINQTSGIPPQFESIPSLDDDKALEEFVRSMNSYYINQTPGLSYEASRESFCVAGLIISKVSGMSYAAYMDKYIFGPLQMTRTTTDPKKLAQLDLNYGHEIGLTSCLPAKKDLFNSNYLPAGSEMRSTAADIGHYLIALLNGGQYKGQQILSPESIAKMWTPQISFNGLGTMLGGNGINIEYTLGWLKMMIDDRPLIIHPGNTGTMSSITGINLGNNTAMTVLFNADPGRFNRFVYPSIENVGNNILHLLAGEPTTDFARPRIDDPFDDYYAIPRAEQEKYIGTYVSIGDAHPVYKDYSIEVFEGENDSLALKGFKDAVQKGHYKLQFSSKSRAVLRGIEHPREIQFKLNPNGAVTGIFIYGSEFKKKEPTKASLYQEIENQQATASFLLPKNWNGVWTNNQFTATSPAYENTSVKVQAMDLGIINFEKLVEQHTQGQTIQFKGLQKKEVVKDGVWTEQMFCINKDGQTTQHLLVLYQDPLVKKQVQFILSNPWGTFTNDLQDLVRQFQRSIVL